ncbi:tumor necrosis factor receptor superfamily member 10A-like isoform X2 [Notamacropus eugenii]|uniref:tumor necrosis factor receptor superfamily member 10A-like isoform X2 n=1 Tax=Notamacropus eugenii TaxID=9315 RepID=UPI003B678C6A
MSDATATLCRPWKDLTFLCLLVMNSVATTQAEGFHDEAISQQRQRRDLNIQCPAGQYLQTNPIAVCRPCHNGIDFTEYPNGLDSCIPCQICKSGQEEVTPCNTTQNTQCRCKSSTFCLKDQPCEVCENCKPKCPKGMVEVSPCSPWSDLKCDYPQPSDTRIHWLPGIAVFTGLGIFFCLFRHCCSISKGNNLPPRNTLGLKHPKAQDHVEKENDRQGKADSAENHVEENHRQLMEVITIPMPSTQNGNHPGQANTMAPQDNPQSLFPVNGDHIKTLEKSFLIFEQVVPFDYWNCYMRHLGLSTNEIQQAKASESNVKDHPHSLLMTWLNKTGKAATVNVLLETLDKINQRAARETIHDRLISSGLYNYQKREEEKPNSESDIKVEGVSDVDTSCLSMEDM